MQDNACIEFCASNIADIWGIVGKCAQGAVVSGLTAAIVAGNIVFAESLFYPFFYACLVIDIGERAAKEVKVRYYAERKYGCYTHHSPCKGSRQRDWNLQF
jgi:hypothetical protein